MTPRRRVIAMAVWAMTGAVLALGFAAYQRPDLAVDLANRLWACF
ncbi:MAG: hypothetical protein ABI699_08470 [Caldimonas sp.]